MNLKETANALRSQAKQLQDEARRLLDAANILDCSTNGARPPATARLDANIQKDISPKPSRRKPPTPESSPKLKIIGLFLKKHPGSLRREIYDGTKINKGTISFLLNFKEYFRHDQNGRWHLTNPDLFQEEREGRIMT